MTVRSDLERATGTRRRLFAKIGGLNNVFWQDDGSGGSPKWNPSTTFPDEALPKWFQSHKLIDADNSHTMLEPGVRMHVKGTLTDNANGEGKVWRGLGGLGFYSIGDSRYELDWSRYVADATGDQDCRFGLALYSPAQINCYRSGPGRMGDRPVAITRNCFNGDIEFWYWRWNTIGKVVVGTAASSATSGKFAIQRRGTDTFEGFYNTSGTWVSLGSFTNQEFENYHLSALIGYFVPSSLDAAKEYTYDVSAFRQIAGEYATVDYAGDTPDDLFTVDEGRYSFYYGENVSVNPPGGTGGYIHYVTPPASNRTRLNIDAVTTDYTPRCGIETPWTFFSGTDVDIVVKMSSLAPAIVYLNLVDAIKEARNRNLEDSASDIGHRIAIGSISGCSFFEGPDSSFFTKASFSGDLCFRITRVGNIWTGYSGASIGPSESWTQIGSPWTDTGGVLDTFRLLFETRAGYNGQASENYLFQLEVRAGDYDPSSATPRGIVCLRPPNEWSNGLDLAEMKVSPSSMMIEFDNIEDPVTKDGTKFFAKMFAPGRWNSSTNHTTPTISPPSYINADATSIDVKSTGAFPSSGTIHIGQEAISYTSKTGLSFDGVIKGLYPAYGSYWGSTYRVPDEAEIALQVSTVPYCVLGRMVALYVITWDEETNDWHQASDGELIWIGRITDSIVYDSSQNVWQLGCQHLAQDLEKKLATGMPEVPLSWINIFGPLWDTLTITAYGTWFDAGPPPVLHYGDLLTVGTIQINGLFKKHEQVASGALNALNDPANWTNPPPGIYFNLTQSGQDGKYQLSISNYTTRSARFYFAGVAHWLNVLGFGVRGENLEMVNLQNGETAIIDAAAPPFVAYHPLNYAANGMMMITGSGGTADAFWAKQGDYGVSIARAAVMIKGAVINDGWTVSDKDRAAIDRYSYKTTQVMIDGTNAAVLGLSAFLEHLIDNCSYVGQRVGEDPKTIVQVWIPEQIDDTGAYRGPFELLLFPLLSTGTADYNYTVGNGTSYDKLPLEVSAGIMESLVDKDSFLAADKRISGNQLAVRNLYVIDEPVSWIELLQREGKLFGYFLAWQGGKFVLKSANSLDADSYVETIDESVRAKSEEWVSPSSSVDVVVNSWKIKCNYNLSTGKYLIEAPINDAVSIDGLHLTKSIDIEHPGVNVDNQLIVKLLVEQATAGFNRTRFPWQTVDITLGPTKFNRISIGDIVRYQSSWHPDPYGSGNMTADCYGLVINISWALGGDEAWTGKATLLLNDSIEAARRTPYAASALVDKSATNGGWNATNRQLTLVALYWGASTDADDGADFQAGDIVVVRERAPANPASPQEWAGLELAKAYEADGAQLLTFVTGTTLTGWDPDKEYFVTVDEYASTTASQKTRNSWQANATTALLGTADQSEVWG